MKQDRQDRRSQRTRHLITDATLALLFEKRYEAITIQDILERANIGRSTFYTHYFDKEDVLASITEQMIETFDQQCAQRHGQEGIVPALELFEHVQQQYHYFQAILRCRAGDVLWQAAQATLSKGIEQTLAMRYPEQAVPPVPRSVIAHYVSGSFLSLLKWWLQAEMPYPPAQMERMFQQLALPGIQAAIGDQRGIDL